MRPLPVAAALLLALAACQTSERYEGNRFTGADRAAIVAECDTWENAMRAGDWDAMARQYTEDAMLMPPNAPAVSGREAVLALLASMPEVTRMDLQIVDIDGRGDLAYVVGTYSMTLKIPGVGTVDDRGKYMEIRRRGPRGSWPITRDIYNSDLAAHE